MTLTDFIRGHISEILRVWEHDAKQILPHHDLTRAELRDHAEQMLLGILAELERSDVGYERPPDFNARHPDCKEPARIHGVERFELGADIVHVAAEFRALRVTVIQLWAQVAEQLSPEDIEHITRFNTELDKALSQSIKHYVLKKQKQGRLFETMLATLPDPCYILHLDGTFLYANQAMAELCGFSSIDMIGKNSADCPLTAEFTVHQLQELARHKEEARGEVAVRTLSGRCCHFEFVYAPVYDDKGEVEAISGIAHDITVRKRSEAEIWRHANYDLLTDVPNRRLFLDRLEQHVANSDRTGNPFALFFVDLDHFKEINDELGHDVGDELLKSAAERIDACVRQSDTVARMGGDEFTVILLNTNNIGLIEEIAKKILARLAQPFHLGSHTVSVSASVGITLFPNEAGTTKQLLKNADQAMYYAKQLGRNRVCFFSDTTQKGLSARQQLISDLRSALQTEQLRLHYQPVVDLASGRIVMAEALLRWEHPRKGLLLPGEFLELAEEVGLMASLERWVFKEAAFDADHWTYLAAVEGPLQLTINTSPAQFMDSNHEKPWQRHMETFARSGTNLTVELTENVLTQDSRNLIERLAELDSAGIQLGLDDFGTGSSSLACLKQFKVNYLKIDPSFVQDSSPGADGQAIAETIILMAHKLGLKVVAEGVETAEQRDWLKTVGCDYAQGYFFSESLPSREFEQLLQTGRVTH